MSCPVGIFVYVAGAQPLRRDTRLAVQVINELIATPLAIGLAGGVMLLFTRVLGFDIRLFGVIMLVTFILWIAASRSAWRRYVIALRDALQRRHVVDRHPNLATQAAQVLVGQEEHEEGDPVGTEALAATKHQGGDQHQDQEPFGGHREVKDEHHEEGDGGQVPAHDRWNQPGPAPGLAHRCILASLRNRIPHAIGWQLRPS